MKKGDYRQFIRIKGANEHNLKNVSVDIPRNELVVLTGLSGSGKSSLAFDTIYAEGQRRYMESLSSYARQFLGQMEKPNVESIEGLSPAISIDQKSTNRNPRSTVGTVTEIYDYFRLLYARVGIPHCPKCGRELTKENFGGVNFDDKPDMREKIREYIGELDDEYTRLEVELGKHLDDEACVVTEFKTKMVTLLEVKNDLQGRLEEVI